VRVALLICALSAVVSPAAWALAPGYKTDYELSQNPVVVVAQWDRAERTPHQLIHGNVCERSETFTELNVPRVIKGDVKPGKYRLMYSYGLDWRDDGTGLSTWTSTDMLGDVENVTQPNLWLLDRARSWDPNDRTEYLDVPHYRAIQPLALEPYFKALLSADRDREVPRLLSSTEPLVVRRALSYICGYIWPWPFEPGEWDFYDHPDERERRLVDAAAAVKSVIDGQVEEPRPLAVAVYAELTGDKSTEVLRALLTDQNAAVRGVAIGLLARRKDADSIPAMIKAASGVTDGEVACKICEVVQAWGELRAAPVLFPFLEIEASPASPARSALHALTGCWFPYHTAGAAATWAQAQAAGEAAQQRRRLSEALSDPEFPVAAELVGGPRPSPPSSAPGSSAIVLPELPATATSQPAPTDMAATVRVHNVVKHPVVLSKMPSELEQRWPAGSSGNWMPGYRGWQTVPEFVTLAPGESLEFEVVLDASFLLAEPADRKLSVTYLRLDHGQLPNAWIGELPVRFGELWHEERKAGHVEELWPNGNLRAVGSTVNGQRVGEWEFFNEAGDRIRTVGYTGGGGSAECNPEYPTNKGAGRRPPSATQPSTTRPAGG
jgi:hypothetical protein